jgi:hypothetical protein
MLYGTDLNSAFSFSLDQVHGGGGEYDTNYASFGGSTSDYYGGAGGGGGGYKSSGTKHHEHSYEPLVKAKRDRGDKDMVAATSVSSSSSSSSSSSGPVVTASSISDSSSSMSIPSTPHASPAFATTSDEKLERMASELQRAREYIEKNSHDSYLEKLMSKRRDVLKMIMFMFIILLALSLHHIVKHYYKMFFEEYVVTPAKEFFVRIVYPLVVIFAIWNMRTFV